MEEKKTPKVLIIFLILIILGLGGYIAVDKLILNKSKNDTTTVVVVDDVKLDLNAMYQISNTLTKFDKAFNDSSSKYFGYIYKIDKSLIASKFNKEAALFVSMYDDMIGTNTAQYLVGENVKKNYEKIFGKNLEYKPSNVNAGNEYNIVYNDTNGNYSYTAPTTSTVYKNGYYSQTIKTNVEEETINVTRRVFYVEYKNPNGSNDVTEAEIYANDSKSKLIGTVSLRNNVLSEKEVLAKYGSKVSEYTYTFKQNSSTDDYCFYSIEKIK